MERAGASGGGADLTELRLLTLLQAADGARAGRVVRVVVGGPPLDRHL